MVDAVVSGPELPVLDVADQVLREERVASPETIRDVHPSAETLHLGTGEALHRAPDHGAVDVEPDHQIRGEASGEAGEVVPAMRADEVRDDVPARPVAARELVVIERDRRGPRVLEPGVEPVLAEELEQVDASDAARGAPLGEKIRREPVTDAAARPALPTGVVPIELPVEPEIAAREEVAIDVAETDIRVEPRETVGSLLGVRADVAESRVEDRLRVLLEWQVGAQAIEHHRTARTELEERGRREGQPCTDPALEGPPLAVDEGNLMIRVGAERLRAVDRGEREEPRRRPAL